MPFYTRARDCVFVCGKAHLLDYEIMALQHCVPKRSMVQFNVAHGGPGKAKNQKIWRKLYMKKTFILQHSHLKELRKYGNYSHLRHIWVKNIRTCVAAPQDHRE